MKFREKHPYLFWELIGLAVLFIDFLILIVFVVLLGEETDAVFATVVFTAIFAGFILFLSPAIVYIKRKNSKNSLKARLDRFAVNLCTRNHKYVVKTLFVCLLALFAFIIVAGIFCYLGWAVFAPLGIYAGAVIYIAWEKHILSEFYKVENAEQYCELITVEDTAFFDNINKKETLTSIIFDLPEPEFLNFIYNRLNFQEVLKDKKLKIYVVNAECLNKKYSFKTDPDLCLLCIMREDLNVLDSKSIDSLYDESVFSGFDRTVQFLMTVYMESISR